MTIVDPNEDHAERTGYAPGVGEDLAPKAADSEDPDEEMPDAWSPDDELSISDDLVSGFALRGSVITAPDGEPEKIGVDLLTNLAEEGIYGLPDSDRDGTANYEPELKYTEGD